MPKLSLLKSEADFAQFRSSKSFQNQWLRIRVRNSSSQNVPRFGFIIPKKVLPKAVDRNKVKRRLKAVLSKLQSKLSPADVLLFPGKLALKQKFPNLEAEVVLLFKKANLWKL